MNMKRLKKQICSLETQLEKNLLNAEIHFKYIIYLVVIKKRLLVDKQKW